LPAHLSYHPQEREFGEDPVLSLLLILSREVLLVSTMIASLVQLIENISTHHILDGVRNGR